MRVSAVSDPLLLSTLWPADGRTKVLRAVALTVLGSLLMWASAKVQVPFWPVPMTMQTYVVLVLAAVCGPRLGAATVLLYLAEGALGLPVFAGTPERGLGVAYMVGPTGGFLVGFLMAVIVTGWLAERGWSRSLPLMLAAMALGHVVLFVPGILWLAALIGWDAAIAGGLTPFWAASLLKTLLAAATLPLAWKVLDRA